MGLIVGIRRRFLQNAVDKADPVRSLLRWPRWLFACVTKRPVVAGFATGGLRMRLVPKLSSFGTTSIFIKRDSYEPEVRAIENLIEPGTVALDIGGSFGVFALFLAHYVGPGGAVHTFEPGRFSFDQLQQNVALNAVGERIKLHHVAASDREDVVRLFHLSDSPVNFSLGDSGGDSFEDVRAARVDVLVPVSDAARVTFIKIDVEGYERTALEGARAILEQSRPTIMFEVSGGALKRQGMSPADMYEYLATYGYRFFILEDERFVMVRGHPEGNIFASIRDLATL